MEMKITATGQLKANPTVVDNIFPTFMQARLSIPRVNRKGHELVTVQAYGELSAILGQFAEGDTVTITGPCFSSAWIKGGNACSGITVIAESID